MVSASPRTAGSRSWFRNRRRLRPSQRPRRRLRRRHRPSPIASASHWGRSTVTILARSDKDGGDKGQNDLVGAELTFRALPSFLGGVSLKQMALWSFNGDDDGLTGRSVASLDFAPDLGIIRPTLAINGGGVYGKGVQDGLVAGPEIGIERDAGSRLQDRPEGCLRLPVPQCRVGRGHSLGRSGSRHPVLIRVVAIRVGWPLCSPSMPGEAAE